MSEERNDDCRKQGHPCGFREGSVWVSCGFWGFIHNNNVPGLVYSYDECATGIDGELGEGPQEFSLLSLPLHQSLNVSP